MLYLQEVLVKKLTFASLAFVFLSFCSPAWADTPHDNFNAAQSVIENWFSAIKNHQLEQAASFLAPQFVSIRTDGIVRNKAEEIKLIKNLTMESYQLSDFKFSQSGNIIIVTYKDIGSALIDKTPTGRQAAGRMAVLQKQNGKWVILAYANLDKIG